MNQNDDSCKIEVPVPHDANLDQIQKAVADKLQSSFTDLDHCRSKKITIDVKFNLHKAAT